MTNLLRIICISWIFWRICKAEESNDDLITLATSVQKFYSSPSIVIVYDRHVYGFDKENSLLEMMKSYSRQDRLSQFISFDDLNDEKSRHRDNALYVLVIEDEKNLEHAINVTKNDDISTHSWLLFTMNNNTGFDCNRPGEDFFRLRFDSKMTAKCKGNDLLKKYYSVFENRTEVVDLAEWTSEKKLIFKNRTRLHKIETDMKGITLKIANKTKDSLGGFVTELVEEVKNMCNFKIEQGPQDYVHGYYDRRTEQWTGLIGIVSEKMADIGAVLFNMSKARRSVVDYVTLFIRSHTYLYAKIPEHAEVNWVAYFQVFDRNSKIAILLSILMFTVLLCLIAQRTFNLSFFEKFIVVWSIYTQRGYTEQSTSNSIRIVYLSILIWSLLLNFIYSAGFTSYVTVLTPSLPFYNFEEFKRDNTYGVSVIMGGSNFEVIMYSNDTLLSPLKNRLKKSCLLPKNTYEGLLQTCEKKVAFLTNEVFHGATKNYIMPCKIDSIKVDRVEHTSFVLTKNSPYTKTISHSVLRLTETGISKRLMNKYSRKITELSNLQSDVVSLRQVFPIFAIWIIGSLIALLGLILEIIVFPLHRRYKISFIMNRH